MAIPFSGVAGFSFLGEYAMEGAFYVFLLVLMLAVPHVKNMKVPRPFMLLFALLSVAVFFSFIFNVDSILGASLKGRTGVNKYISSIPVMYFGFLVAILTFNVVKNGESLYRSVVKPSTLIFGFCVAVSLVEFGAWFSDSLLSVYDLISQVFRAGRWPSFSPGRLQSVTFEPSVFGLFLGYMFVIAQLGRAVHAGKKERYFKYLFWIVVALMVVANARTATVLLVGLAGGLAVCRVLLRLNDTLQRIVIFAVFPLLVIGFGSSLVYIHDIVVESILAGDSVSNLSRYASNVAAFSIFVDNPIFGVGLGQYAFVAYDMLPEWAWNSYEINNWFVDPDFTWPPVYSLPLRIGAELGVFGLVSWYGVHCYILNVLLRRIRQQERVGAEARIGKALLSAVFYVFLSGISYDSFRNFSVWVLLGVIGAYVVARDPESQFSRARASAPA